MKTSVKYSELTQHARSAIWNTLPLIAVVLYPTLFLYSKNFSIVRFHEVVNTSGLFFINAIPILLISAIYFRNYAKSILFTCFGILLTILYRILENLVIKVFPMLYYWHIVYIFLTLLLLFAFIIKNMISEKTVITINKIIAYIFTGLLLINLISTVPEMISTIQKEKVARGARGIEGSEITVSTNVYYFIFDEYSGLDALERYTGFDNSSFYAKLAEIGFNTSPHSRNYSPSTNVEIPNILNLSLTLTEKNYTNAARDEILKDPALFQLFYQYGYSINIIDDQGFIPVDNLVFKDSQIYTPQNGLSKAETFQLVLLKNSIYYPLLLEKEGDRIQEINELFKAMENSSKLQEEKLLTVGYFMIPHLPWVVDENGNAIDGNDSTNWKDPSIYLGQLKYVSQRMISSVQRIIEKDSDSIIIIQSDHALRLPIHLKKWYNQEIDNEELELYYQRNILNAVYFKGEKLDIENLSGVNTLIKVLNTAFGQNFLFVEQPK